MGHPRRLRRKFSYPIHPWQKERIEEEKILVMAYGFKNKREIWKIGSLLGKFKVQSKKLIVGTGSHAEDEKSKLLKKLTDLGLLKPNARIADVLGISLKDILERRLQYIVLKKNLAKTTKQARQFITHEHIAIGDKTITSPSYLVKVEEEVIVNFNPNSSLMDTEHPARKIAVAVGEVAK